ncbi:MAG: tRNA pseudouridine(55) synthase TruB [Gammaproteobacteria bacterium]
MARRNARRVNGILLLDKPLGLTSNAALQQVKRMYRAAKAGHTGSLDPLATGLLPLCLGEATKMSAYLLDADKRYQVRAQLGIKTETADAEGDVLLERPVPPLDESIVEAALAPFRGDIKQIPPMYSALKKDGDRLYALARKGIEVEREAREVTIHELRLVSMEEQQLLLDVHCSKGTYIRTLVEDIGEALGCGAHVAALHRSSVGPFNTEAMVDMDQVEQASESGFDALDALLIPLDTAISDWPKVSLNQDTSFYLRQGQPVIVPKAPTQGLVALYQAADEGFIGVGEVISDGRIAPRRLFNLSA